MMEKEVWYNSEKIAQNVFNLRNWARLLEYKLPEDFCVGKTNKVCKAKIFESLNRSIDAIALLNRTNMDLTSNNG